MSTTMITSSVLHRAYAQGPFGQMHFRVCDAGRPLLLCHQSPSSSQQFDAPYQPLAQRAIRAIGVDTPGFGQSDVPQLTPTIEDYADSVVAVLDHCSSTRSVRPDFAYAELTGGTRDIVDEQPVAWCDAVAAFIDAA